MEWTAVKSAKQINLLGVEVEIDRSENAFRTITFTDPSGNKLRVAHNSYSMTVEVPSPPKTTEKFAVTGEVLGVPISETFDDSYQANSRKQELKSGTREEINVRVEPIQVEEEIPF